LLPASQTSPRTRARRSGIRLLRLAPIRDQAERELRKLGHHVHWRTRPDTTDGAGVESLTEPELQAARLVADRKTNPQISADCPCARRRPRPTCATSSTTSASRHGRPRRGSGIAWSQRHSSRRRSVPGRPPACHVPPVQPQQATRPSAAPSRRRPPPQPPPEPDGATRRPPLMPVTSDCGLAAGRVLKTGHDGSRPPVVPCAASRSQSSRGTAITRAQPKASGEGRNNRWCGRGGGCGWSR
jgi:hypothetical protein